VGDVRIGLWTVGIAAAALVFLLVASAVIGVFLARDEIRAGGMEDKWVFLNHDSFGNELMVGPGAYIDSRGTIICYDWPHGLERGFTAIDPNGTLLWRSITNACPSITEGPDGGYYYVDWNTSDASSASWSNISALYSNGDFRWDYVVPNGTLDLWAIYPDGQVIAHNYDWQNMDVDRIIAISNEGTELWSMDSPFLNSSLGNPRLSDNGTFEVIGLRNDGTYIMGITKDGTQVYIEKGDYVTHYMESSWDPNGDTYYEVRKEFIDNDTSVMNVYAISLLNGSVEWKTLLHYSDNPDHTMPGVYSLSGTLVDAEGRIFCGDLEDKYSYSLNSSGAIQWKKPYVGVMIDTFSSGGVLVWDDSSIKRINPDGSLAWRHYAELDGYSFILLGSDETVYYSYGAEVHALVQSSGLSGSAVVLVILVVVDVVAIILYSLAYVLKSGRTSKT
jgi:hypothetical protein